MIRYALNVLARTHTLTVNALASKFHTDTPDTEIVEHSCPAVVHGTPGKSSLYTRKPFYAVNAGGIYVIIKGRVIKCPSISNMEDMAVTRTPGREGATYY